MKETKTNFTLAEMANMTDDEILEMVDEYRNSRKIAEARINLLNALTQYAQVLDLDIDENTANMFINTLENYENILKEARERDLDSPFFVELADLQQVVEKYLK